MLKGVCSRCRPRPYALRQHDLGGFKTSLAKAACVIAASYIKITNCGSHAISPSDFEWMSHLDLRTSYSVASWMWLCAYVLATFFQKLETPLDPLERRSGIFAPGDLHVVFAKHSTAGNNFGRDGKGSARSLRVC
jgi:hypothetical protein